MVNFPHISLLLSQTLIAGVLGEADRLGISGNEIIRRLLDHPRSATG
jgi:hypothetical protein